MTKILIADDDFTIGMQIEEMITALGYDVVGQAGSGQEAVEMARDLRPDIILMDVVMPGELNGINAAEKIKAEWDVPIVFISGHGESDYIQEAKQIEPYGYVMKPFDENEIKAFVEIALHKHKMEKQLKQAHEQLERTNLGLQMEMEARKKTERALRESEKLYRDIFEKNNAIKWLLDPSSGDIVDANPAACEFYQYSHEEITKLRLWDINMEGEAEMKKLLASADSGEKTEFTFKHRLASGEIRYVQIYTGTIETGGKKLLHSIIIDITERKQAEEAVRESEERFRVIFEQSLMAIVIVQDDRIKYVNQAYLEMTGYTWEEIMNWTVGDIVQTIYPEDRHFVMEQGRKKAAGIRDGVVTHYAYRGVTKSGEARWIDQYSKTITYRGKPANLMTFIDIHDQKLALETLRKSEERYRELADSLPEIVFETDEKGSLSYVNRNAFDYFGYTESDFDRDLNALQMIIPEDRYRAMENMQKAINGELSDSGEYAALRKDGITFPILIHSKAFFRDNKPMGLRGIIIDLTDIRRAEETLRDSEETLKSIFIAAPIGIGMVSDRVIKQANDRLCEMTGYSKDELIGQSARIFYPTDEEFEYVGREKYVLIRDFGTGTVETKFQRKDGKVIDILLSSTPMDPDDLVRGVTFTALDITERKKAEEALRESEEKYRLLIENATDAIFIAQDEILKFANPKAEELTGYSVEELVKIPFIDIVHPEDRDMVLERHVKRLKGEEIPSIYSFRILNRSGEVLSVELNAVLISWEGRPATLNFLRDITAQKRLEAQLQQAQKMEAIGTLAGGIAHDFNNILGIILGNAELAMDDVPEWNPARNNLGEVRKACLRAKDVVRQILAFSRKSETEQKAINMATVVTESLKLLRASIPTSIDIRQNIASDIHNILGDPTQIHQIMMNLCTNAAHAMEDDGGTLEVTIENRTIDEDYASKYSELHPGPYVQLRVSDTGDGISPELIDRIFDPYFTTKDVDKGTGLGLSVVHGIVNSHHGRISVESKAGKGTTFSILFLAVERQIRAEQEESQELPIGKESILFVDDEESMVTLNQQRLEKLGYTVIPKTDPSEALEFFRAKPDQIDLVITDMTMPHMTGDRLAEEILKIRTDTPIILCTGYSQRMSEERAHALGTRKYIEKPIEMVNLARSIREVLDGK